MKQRRADRNEPLSEAAYAAHDHGRTVETDMLFIRNAHILPIVGEEIENGCVLINEGKIAEIGPELHAPRDAEVIDAGGRLVTPSTRW